MHRNLIALGVAALGLCCSLAAAAYAADPTPTPGLDERLKAINDTLTKIDERVGTIEKQTQQPDSKECPGYIIEAGTAETNCPIYTDVTTALELQQADDFAEPFPHIGFRGRIKLPELFERPTVIRDAPTDSQWFGEDPAKPVNYVLRPHAYIDVSLASIAVPEASATASPAPTAVPSTGPAPAATATDDEKDPIKLDGERSFDMRGGLIVDLVDYRTRTRTERYLEVRQAEMAAVAALKLAEKGVEDALDEYSRKQVSRLEKLLSGMETADLEATVAAWKRMRDANLGDEASAMSFKKSARAEADKAEKAWRDEQEKERNADTALRQANKAFADAFRKAEKDGRSRALATFRAERALAEAMIGRDAAERGEDAAAKDKAKETLLTARTAYEDALLAHEDGDDEVVDGLRAAEAAKDSAAVQLADAKARLESARDALAAIVMRETAYEHYFQARARVREYRERYYTQYAPVISLAAVGEMGARTPDIDDLDLLQSHFLGARIYYRGASLLNGMFLEVGWGTSENLITNTDKRVKFRANLPFRFTSKGTTPSKAFVRFEVDSDFRGGEDEVRLSIGNAVDFNRILNILGMGAIGG